MGFEEKRIDDFDSATMKRLVKYGLASTAISLLFYVLFLALTIAGVWLVSRFVF